MTRPDDTHDELDLSHLEGLPSSTGDPNQQAAKQLAALRQEHPELTHVIETYTSYGNSPQKVLEFAHAQLEIFSLLNRHPDLQQLFDNLAHAQNGPLYDLQKLREAIQAKQYTYDQLEISLIRQLGVEKPPEDLLQIAKQHVLPVYKEYLGKIGWSHCLPMTQKLVDRIGGNAKVVELAYREPGHMNHYVAEYRSENGSTYVLDITFDQYAGERVGPKIMKSNEYFQLINNYGYRRI